MGKYFTVEVKPTIAASKQHIGAFQGGDLLFDWTEFEIPKGTARLVNATLLIRPKGDSSPNANDKATSLVFSKSNTQTLGVINSNVLNRPSNDFLGNIEFVATDFTSPNVNSTAVATSPTTVKTPFVLSPDMSLAATDGYSKIYIAGIAGVHDFSTIIRLNDASGNMDVSVAGTTIATDGTSMDIQEHFIAGDILHAHDDAVIGTVASVTSGTDLELTSNFTASTLLDDDYVYNIHPIRIILQFEQ